MSEDFIDLLHCERPFAQASTAKHVNDGEIVVDCPVCRCSDWRRGVNGFKTSPNGAPVRIRPDRNVPDDGEFSGCNRRGIRGWESGGVAGSIADRADIAQRMKQKFADVVLVYLPGIIQYGGIPETTDGGKGFRNAQLSLVGKLGERQFGVLPSHEGCQYLDVLSFYQCHPPFGIREYYTICKLRMSRGNGEWRSEGVRE